MNKSIYTKPTDFKEQNSIISEHVVPTLPGLIASHHQGRFEWFPTDLLPASANMNAEQLELVDETKQQAKKLPNIARCALVLNLITEEGLPSYHRLLHDAFGADEAWATWRNQWTAEEDRHGNIIRDYIRDCRLVDMKQVEQMQFEYVANGWAPEWSGDPYMTIAYTSFQERATQYSHRNLGKFVRQYTPNLTRVLSCVAGDESRHYKFYCSLLKTLVKVDTRRALESMFKILQIFKMPGHEMPCFSNMSLVEHSLNIFGPQEFSAVINDVLNFIGLEKLTQLDNYCEDLRQKLLAYPTRLMKLHNRLIDRVKDKVSKLEFSFLTDPLAV